MNYIILIILILGSIADFKKREFPVECQVALVLLLPYVYVNENVWGVILALPFFIASCVSKGMGGGDWKAVGLLGLCLGFAKTYMITVIGCITFIIFGYILQRKKGEGKILFPFIPSLTVGYIVTLILEVYMNWSR